MMTFTILRVEAFDEVLKHNRSRRDSESPSHDENEMMCYFEHLITTYRKEALGEELSEDDLLYLSFAYTNVIDTTTNGHLPVPVFSYTRPTDTHKFIMHVLLSMGRFSTEAELTMHATLRECFVSAKLIGRNDDVASLQDYSNKLLKRFITDQMVYFSNSQRVLGEWITLIGEIFDSIIVRNELLVSDMPSVQLSTVLQSMEDADQAFRLNKKTRLVEAAYKEIGTELFSRLPSKEDVLVATKEYPVAWDPVNVLRRSRHQSLASFNEQKLAIEVAIASIDKYKDINLAATVTKNVGIRGFPGGGKTWCCMYVALYAMSQGLDVLATAIMAKRATALGGTHWHRFFGLPIDAKLTPQRMAELALNKIANNPQLRNAIMSLDVIIADELGQLSAEFVATINIILCKLRGTTTLFGGILLIGSLDHTQIQPWEVSDITFLTLK
jgi:hypothetical protein